MTESFLDFYGVDWLAMILSLSFLYTIGNHKRYGFLINIAANIAWITTNYLAGVWPGVFLNILLILMNLRAYYNWEDPKKNICKKCSH
mgnify:FL=1